MNPVLALLITTVIIVGAYLGFPFIAYAIFNLGAAFSSLGDFLVAAFLVVVGLFVALLLAAFLVRRLRWFRRAITGRQQEWKTRQEQLKNETPEERRQRWLKANNKSDYDG